jgi:hypothetical protein
VGLRIPSGPGIGRMGGKIPSGISVATDGMSVRYFEISVTTDGISVTTDAISETTDGISVTAGMFVKKETISLGTRLEGRGVNSGRGQTGLEGLAQDC